MTCLHCHAEVSNGLALCELCQHKASTIFTVLPAYFRNLARWRPGRAGSRPVPGSRVLYDGGVPKVGTGDRISDTLDETTTALTTWAQKLTGARTYPTPLTLVDAVLAADLSPDWADTLADDQPQLVALLCAGFHNHLTSVSTTDWCGDLIRDLDQREAILRRLTETSVPGWYAGACTRCGTSTYVMPGLTWVTCNGCGNTSYARDHLEVVLNEASDWVAGPKQIADAVVALVDTEQSVPRLHSRIRQWSSRGDITPIRHTARGYAWSEEADRFIVADEEVGRARYRLGDVLDRILTAGATRLTKEDAPNAATR